MDKYNTILYNTTFVEACALSIGAKEVTQDAVQRQTAPTDSNSWVFVNLLSL